MPVAWAMRARSYSPRFLAGFPFALQALDGDLDAHRRPHQFGDVRPLSNYTNPAAGPDCAVPPGLLLGFSAFTPAQIRAGIGCLERVIC